MKWEKLNREELLLIPTISLNQCLLQDSNFATDFTRSSLESNACISSWQGAGQCSPTWIRKSEMGVLLKIGSLFLCLGNSLKIPIIWSPWEIFTCRADSKRQIRNTRTRCCDLFADIVAFISQHACNDHRCPQSRQTQTPMLLPMIHLLYQKYRCMKGVLNTKIGGTPQSSYLISVLD